MNYRTESLAEELYKNRFVNESSNKEDAADEKVSESTSKDWSGYKVRFNYEGDSLSDYQTTVIVKAGSEKEALAKAEKEVKKHYSMPYRFEIEDVIPSYNEYKNKYKLSNLRVFEGANYDFSKDEDKKKACAEYSKCQQNCLSSSAEKRMSELNKLADKAGLKFVMTNYSAYAQPRALVTPKFDLVEK